MDNLTNPDLSLNASEHISTTFLSIARQQFINDIKSAIGAPDETTLPLSIKPILQQLLEASDQFLQTIYPQQMIFRLGGKPSSNRSVYEIHDCCEMSAANNAENSSAKGISEETFMACFYKAMEACDQGWHCLSCWSASEQNDCYSIFWGLKIALEKYQHASQKSEKKLGPSALPFWQRMRSPVLALVDIICQYKN